MNETFMFGIYAGLTRTDVQRRLRQAYERTNNFKHGLEPCETVTNGLHTLWSQGVLRLLFGDQALEQIINAGMTLSPHPALCVNEVAAWKNWLSKQDSRSPIPVPITVEIDRETLTYKGCNYHCERTLALVLRCLIDARGEIRSINDIRNMFPDEPFEERLDLTIKRKLIPHVSGVGQLVESVSKRGYRLRHKAGG